MSLFSALRRKPEEDDLYEDYEANYDTSMRTRRRTGNPKGSSRSTA